MVCCQRCIFVRIVIALKFEINFPMGNENGILKLDRMIHSAFLFPLDAKVANICEKKFSQINYDG